MGMIQSIFCSITFCVERVLTWTCCAFLLIMLMFTLILLMVYGISVGYHYAQKELASYAMVSRTTPEPDLMLRAGPEPKQPVVRLVAVNKTDMEHGPKPIVEHYIKRNVPESTILLDTTSTHFVLLETEIPPSGPELSPQERDLAKRLIGRFRRSKNFTQSTSSSVSTTTSFLRPLKNSTDVKYFT